MSQAILITLTGDENTRTVSYNINKGWDASEATWATMLPPPINIADQLIVTDQSLAEKATALLAAF